MTNFETIGIDCSGLNSEQLVLMWRQHLIEPVPDYTPKSLLAAFLAYRLQVEQHGGLLKKTVAYLKVIEKELREARNLRPLTSKANRLSDKSVRATLSLSFLAPDIVDSAIEGHFIAGPVSYRAARPLSA